MNTDSFDSLKDLLTSAMPSKAAKPLDLDNTTNFLSSLKGSSLPTPSKPAAKVLDASKLVKMYLPVSNFKQPVPEYGFPSQLVTASESYIAYVVNRKKVRIIAQAEGQKGMMDQQKEAQGSIISIGLKGERLASLTDQGELMIGRVYPQSKDSLGFDPTVSLTFPDLSPSRSLVWSSGRAPLLAIHGTGPSVFIVWLEPKPLAVELPHSLGLVKSVTFYGGGKYVAVSDGIVIECFAVEEDHRSFRKVAQLSLGLQGGLERVLLFEDREQDFVIAAVRNGKFIVCPVTIGQPELIWIDSGVALDMKRIPSLPIVYDAELAVFVVDGLAMGGFGVLGFRSDEPGLALVPGNWTEPLVAQSLVLVPSQRDVSSGIHLPLYVFQPIWVSFHGLELPSTPSKEPNMSVLTESPSLPSESETAESKGQEISQAKLEEVVRAVMMERLVPAIEASVNEMLRQVQGHLIGTSSTLESRLDALTTTVSDLKRSVEALPSAGQIADVLSPTLGSLLAIRPSEAVIESADDLLKAELEECLTRESPSAALTRVLQAGNLPVLVWLLERLDLVSTVEATSEAVLLSLAQQLGTDLSGPNAELKLDWLAEIFTAFRAPASMDPVLITEVLEELFAALRVLFAELPSDSALLKKVKVVMRLVRYAQSD